MLINIFLLLYLLFMAYWWSQQGLFSALLHLVSVILAGALAFALWEPMAMLMMKWDMLTRFAWGLSLILIFVFMLLCIRFAYDKGVKANMHFHAIFDLIGGGLFGLYAGFLTAGVTIIGFSFMAVGPAFGGYQPLILDAGGQVVDNPDGDLWVGVDGMAASLFSGLSNGAFCPFNGRPLAQYQPQLERQTGLFRLSSDAHASVVILPGSVQISEMIVVPTPVDGLKVPQRRLVGDLLSTPGSKAVLITTKWTQEFGTYDGDNTVRVMPSQMQLAVKDAEDPSGGVQLISPVAGNKFVGPSAPRKLFAFDNAEVFLAGVDNEDSFGWLYLIPQSADPQFMLVRHTRMPLPDSPDTEPAQLVASLGAAAAVRAATSDDPNLAGGVAPGQVGARQGFRHGSTGKEVFVSTSLPMPISKVKMTGTLSLSSDGRIDSGEGSVKRPEGGMSHKLQVKDVYVPSHMSCVQVRLGADRASSVLGGAIAAAASLAQPLLYDSNGNHFEAFGYIWSRKGYTQDMKFDRIRKIRSTRDLPVRRMGSEDAIHLYFQVPKGRQIVKFTVGQTTQQVNLTTQ